MPGPSGLDLQVAFQEQDHALPIVFLTGHGDIPMSVRAMKAGAVDFLTKPVQRDELPASVQNALAWDAASRAARNRVSTFEASCQALTPRERFVFAFVVTGKLNKQIAAELDVSERTVKAHRSQVMKKMRVTSLTELVRVAEQLHASTRQ